MADEKPHVLIIDDNEDLLEMLKVMFQFKGYVVSVKNNVTGVQELVSEIKPGVVVMDMLLSGADGRDISRRLKSDPSTAEVPILMISAMPNAAQACLDAGADYFVGKPFEMEHMMNTVARALCYSQPL